MKRTNPNPVWHCVLTALILGLSACGSNTTSTPPSDTPDNQLVTLSIIGTNDIHGQLLPQTYRGGKPLFAGFVNALRAARSSANEGVLLIDAGDMWQGTLESNLSEGSVMIEVYNQLGYAAAAVGNHEFDFGPVGERSTPTHAHEDARGALKARAAEAQFPLLAANLIDSETGQPVVWPNVMPSTTVTVAGIEVGIIGVMTIDALETTIAANVRGLEVAPLAATITEEARRLRDRGAALIIVTAHAGGSCTKFDDPYDLSSCEPNEEIMQVARAIPSGLVDHIIAGHQHRGIAHVVNGIAVTASFASTQSFGRVDFVVDPATNQVVNRKIFAPHPLCPFIDTSTDQCAWSLDGNPAVKRARYEGVDVEPDPVIAHIVARAEAESEALKNTLLGVTLETPITMAGRPESALGNLMTDALLDMSPADISLHNISGGIRANLTEGPLTFGKIYHMFPFDNRAVILEVTGAQMKQVIAHQAHKKERRPGFSGMSATVSCDAEQMSVTLTRSNGQEILDDEKLRLAVNDFVALGGDDILTSIIPEGGFKYPSDTPLARDLLVNWLKKRGGTLSADQFLGDRHRRWNMPDSIPSECAL